MSELKITKEKVLDAANKCSTAKETLKTLFPEVFDDEKYYDLSPINTDKSADVLNFGSVQIEVCGSLGIYTNKAFYLSGRCNWKLEKAADLPGYYLIPTKK